MHSPIKTFLFIFSCLIILLSLSWFYDDIDIKIPINKTFTIKIFNIKKHLLSLKENKKDTVNKIISQTDKIELENDSIITADQKKYPDTLKIYQTLQKSVVDKNFISHNESLNNNKNQLKYLLQALKNSAQKSTHILYYGDSQIEEDRFSGYIRAKLQQTYGGSGCGLLPMMPISQWIYPRISFSENWYKWDCYADAAKPNEYYGISAQTFMIDFDKGAAKWNLRCNTSSYAANCLFNKLVLYYGKANEPIKTKFINKNELISEEILYTQNIFDKKVFPIKNNEEITFEFEGFESPYFYGVSLENFNNGVYVDNISLRGSSGTFFHNIPRELLKNFFEELNVSMIILQFGGNVMPMIDSEEKAKQYGDYINYQLKIIKNINPQIPILFIGPADMSVNIDGVMQTHPYLERVIYYIRNAVLNNGYIFFDMYKAMGGKNSMPVWVQENLAAKDYIHFSSAGAKKMSILIYYSLIKDLEEINL